MNAIAFSIVTFFSTCIGGVFALRFRDRIHHLLSFSAGVLLGVVVFEILPELFKLANEQGVSATRGMVSLVVGFLVFHALEKLALIHGIHEGDYSQHVHPDVGILSALFLAGHSFMDGVGIGMGFQISNSVGLVVAIAVISHDFCDGLNTVSLMLANQNNTKRSIVMLLLDAGTPVLGAVSTVVFKIPPSALILYLGFFGGFLLYIGASDILPEAHSKNSSGTTLILIGLTCLGAIFVYFLALA